MALFDKLKKDALLEKAKQAAGKATEFSQKAVDSVKSSVSQTQESLEQKRVQRQQAKLPQEGGYKRYEVSYKGGVPEYPKEGAVGKHPVIYMDVMPDRFSFLPKGKSESWLTRFEIPYCRVIELEIVERTVNTAETLVGIGRENLDFHQKNMIQITYLGPDDEEYIMRCEMITGFTTMGEARVCLELIDLLRIKKILKQFLGREEKKTLTKPASPDVFAQLRKYKKLMDDGIISQEEFEAKKKQLMEL